MGIRDLDAEYAKPKARRRNKHRPDLEYTKLARVKGARSLSATPLDDGLSAEQALAMLRHQDYQCPICLRFLAHPVTPTINSAMSTGEVRGILCTKCSDAIWLLSADPAKFARAIQFLSPEQMQTMRAVLDSAEPDATSR